MLEILAKIKSGKGKLSDLDLLEQLAINTQKGSICGLGKTAPNPVLSTLKYFRHEYEAHIKGECCREV
ncbi:NADH-ubiquinone oxidoreductase-F iron-sulfur binding region domain-containing protein [Marinifilum fragile]|uniref:NADH-ubiquinone oxidoreductase-F iron-sulfur binding region domain-containing protein n=1 Tax=Marinifilum fragile TaxID=570161 RepID=UPI001C48CB73|nr:NADH-ubiquinone oxidoreductase-F iron-sulfur binding region domain-containing protein [Marinifilum fragile]